MDKTLILPDLGEGLQEAEIVDWHVASGDHVTRDQPVVSVETDKVVVEIPSPFSGRVKKLHGKLGDIIKVGAPLVDFQVGGGKEKESFTVVGELESTEPGSTSDKVDKPAKTKALDPKASKVKATPAIRKLAQSLGVDLSAIQATGPGGTVTKIDVENVANGETRPSAQDMRGVRRAMLNKMTDAGRKVVPATIVDEADVGKWPQETDVTLRLIRAVVAGCQAAPSLNAWLHSESQKRTLHSRIDLAIAIETMDGLFAPVIRNAGDFDDAAMRQELNRLKEQVRNRTLARDAMAHPTITLSNFGMFGGRFANLVVMPPQVAILGAGRVKSRVAAIKDKPAVRNMLPLSLSFDHRAVSGVEAAQFLSAAIDSLSEM